MVRTAVVVDDEPITRMDVSQMLEDLGFTVVGDAADGFDAVELCKLKKPDVVLMDIKMPVFDGLRAAETIISQEIAGCVVFLTAFSEKELVEQASQIGVTGYVVKPVNQNLLLPAIEVALSQSSRLREARREIAAAKQKLADSRAIERAKSLLAEEKGIAESEAYRELQQLAMNKRCTLVSVAEAVVAGKSEREVINRAKQLLMQQEGLSESAAYRLLKEMAEKKKCSATALAREIISFGSR